MRCGGSERRGDAHARQNAAAEHAGAESSTAMVGGAEVGDDGRAVNNAR